jgi:hypothetical protein
MSESINKELIQFVADLKRENDEIKWEEVAERAQTKFPKSEGVSLTPNAIRKRYRVWIRKSEDSKRSDNDNQGVETSMSQKTKKQLSPKLPDDLSSYIENYIEEYMRPVIERVSRETAEKVFAGKSSQIQKVPSALSAEGRVFPPAPPMPDTVAGTRRHTVARGKLAGTVDSSLLELFESERRERGCSVSRMLDIIIWNYFSMGQPEPPKLSFELSETARPT